MAGTAIRPRAAGCWTRLRAQRPANPLVHVGRRAQLFLRATCGAISTAAADSGNPVLATEFCGTSVTSSSRPQSRTEQYLAMNPHMRYGRSDRRGFVLMELTPQAGTVLFQALDDVRDAASSGSARWRAS